MNLKMIEPPLIKDENVKMGRILIVDDELDICIMLAKYLKTLSFDCDYVATVKQTIEHIHLHSYELLFVDLNLLEGSGYDVIDYVKKVNLSCKLIVISAHDSEAPRTIQKGADLFISKPFTTRTVLAALKTLNIIPS